MATEFFSDSQVWEPPGTKQVEQGRRNAHQGGEVLECRHPDFRELLARGLPDTNEDDVVRLKQYHLFEKTPGAPSARPWGV